MVVRSLELLRIVEWLNEMKIENYTINDGLSVDVDGDVWLSNRKLKEIPIQFNKVEGDFNCSHNKLASLKGCPTKVGGWFSCENNLLTSLKGAPREVGESFVCSNGGTVEFNVYDVKKVCRVRGHIFV